MGFMANDISGVLVTHRPKKKSARSVGWDGDEVLEGLCERKRERKKEKRSRLEKSKANQEKLREKGVQEEKIRIGLPREPWSVSPCDRSPSPS